MRPFFLLNIIAFFSDVLSVWFNALPIIEINSSESAPSVDHDDETDYRRRHERNLCFEFEKI